MSVITCPSCGTPAPPGAVFCDHCGYDLRTVTPAAPPPVPPTFMAPSADSGLVVCPACQHPNIAGSAFCENCGGNLSQAQAYQQAFEPSAPVAAPPPTPAAAPFPVPQPPVAAGFVTGRLVITDSKVTLPIPSGKTVIVIGREDPVSGVFPDIDLDPHGGHEAGVGRRHAQLAIQGGQLFVEDLDSVNGTAVNRQRVLPHHPHPLNSGDEIRFGKMALIYYAG
jgi:FHA domain/Double zinc ribbon